MILLKLAFGKHENEREKKFDIVKDELLSTAMVRVLADVPKGDFDVLDAFNVVVNGHLIEKEFWPKVKLKDTDSVVITPKISSGDSGQIFKQALIITISVVASVFLSPAVGGGIYGALAVAAVTIGASLALNALIPPPTPELGDLGIGGGGKIDSSQMYSITGQSNQMKRLGIVPKVYGSHRVFPNLAVTPYTELDVDPDTGETIQFLYGIYDFGLGTPQISDIRIGDTPLTTDSFEGFEYRFVDPMKDEGDADQFDSFLEREFKYYAKKRATSQLSIALEDGDENIQFSDENTEGDPQEIILDFVCPRGLYGFTSNGSTVQRSVKLDIAFALVGTSDWHPYNDINFVDYHKSIGGTDVTDFDISLSHATAISTYYQEYSWNYNSYNSDDNAWGNYYIKPGIKKLLVPEDPKWEVGAKVFYGNRLLGIIQTITDIGPAYELTLDRIMTTRFDLQAFSAKTHVDYTPSGPTTPSFTDFTNVKKIRSSRHESGAAVIVGSRQAAVFANFRFAPKVPGQYQIRVRRINAFGVSGSQKADDVTWGGLTTAIKTPPVLTDKRHVFLELRIKATNQLNGHIQNLSAIASSVLPVYDAELETWERQVTSNPAWVFVDLLTGEVNKKAVALSRLHLASISEWADYCDEIPTPPEGQEYLEPRFQCNFILDYDTTLQNLLNQVGSAAQASLNIVDGKYGVLVDRFKETPVQIFTPRNSRDFGSTRIYGPRPHAVRVKYIDPQMNWEVAEAIAYDNGFDADSATDFDDLTSFACTNYEQAWRFGRYMIAQNKLRQENIQILVDFEHLVCTRGDYVQISQDVMRVGGTPARVKEVSGPTITTDDSLDINPDITYGYVYRSTANGEVKTSTLTAIASNQFTLDGDIPAVGDLIVIGEVGKIVFDCIVKNISPNDDMSATLTLVEKADEIFDYESQSTLPDYDPQISDTSRPDWYPPKAVINLEVTDNFWECNVLQSGYNYFVELIWDLPPGSVYEFFEIWVDDGRGYKKFDTCTAKYFRYDVDQSRLDNEHGFKVVAVSASGKKLQLIEMTEVRTTPTTKTDPPSDVDALNMMITNQVLQLSWSPIDDCDVKEYAIRYSPENNDVWESSIPLQIVAKNVNSVSVQARTGVYLIKAIDYNDNQSANASRALTTIPNLFDLNIIETMNEAPTFPGVLDQVELLGEALILTEATPGDVDTVIFSAEGTYEFADLLDLDDVYSVRLQSLIRADGLKKGELMSEWTQLSNVDHLNSALHSDWDVSLQYRATDVFASMSSWAHLSEIDHLNYGAGVGFTDWRDIPTVGDATGRIFQFRVVLKSLADNVTPRLFDATVNADMPDRIDSFENQISSASELTEIAYDPVFKGPGTSPNVQISIDDAESGDYWVFEYKTLQGVGIRIYNASNEQVSRQFDLVAKGFGRRHTSSL